MQLTATHPLVTRIVSQFAHAANGSDLADELGRAGSRGLAHAAAQWEPTRDPPFRVYAAWWVKQAVRERLASMRAGARMSPAARGADIKERAAH